MHPIDLTIIILFLIGLVLFGYYQSRFNKTSEDYFLGGRNLPWWAAMFSIVATETSVLTFISIPGLAYTGNWFFLQLASGYIIGRILVSIFLLPVYFQKGVISIYEILGQKFGSVVQKFASGIFLITRVLADGIRFLATAVIVQVITGWSIPAAVLVVGSITLVYTLLGGIKTVIWVDSFQFVLYLGGAFITIFVLLSSFQDSPLVVINQLLMDGKMKIFHWDTALFTNPWAAVSAVIGGILLSFASHGVDYMMVQRALSCRNLNDGRKAMIGSGVFVFIQFTVFLLVGTLIYQFYNGMPMEKDREFATFILEVLPVGVKGILLAGVLSAAMSTLSSSINSLASSTMVDWLKKKNSLQLSKIVSFFWAAVLITIAMVFDEGDKAIVIVGLQIASFTYGALLGLFLLSKINRNFHPASLVEGLLISMVSILLLKELGLAWTWFIGCGVLVNITAVFLVDICIKPMQKSS